MKDSTIIYTVSQIGDNVCEIYTNDGRVEPKDRLITISNSKLINSMIMISSILNDEGYAVLFEVD